MDNFSIGILNLIILFATLLVIIFYTFETLKLRKVNEKLYILESEKLKPNVVAYFEPNPKDYDIKFFLKNVGGGTAFNIKFQIDPFFDFGDDKFIQYFQEKKLFREGLSLLNPGDEFSMIVGFTTDATEKYINNSIPNEYSVSLEYCDFKEEKFVKKTKISIHQYFDRIIDETNESRNLKKVYKTLEDINSTLKSYIKK